MYNLAMAGMEFLPVAEEIGNYLVQQLPPVPDNEEDVFEIRAFPYPGWGSVDYARGKPSIICRWDGIAFDSPTESTKIKVPNGLRFELRIMHPSLDAPSGENDPYEFAQRMVMEGTHHWFNAIVNNRHLDDRIVDCGVESSIVGDTIDPTTEQPFYAHQLTLVTSLYI